MSMLTDREKEKFLKALEEDREFRYAVMGLLGFREVLERLANVLERQQSLEERFAELGERFAKLEEWFVKLEERIAKLEERFAELEERFARLEEKFAVLGERIVRLEERIVKLEERFTALNERVVELEERFVKLEERIIRLEEEMRDTRRVVAVIAHWFGLLSEAGLREALRYVVEEVLGTARVEKHSIRDDEGLVYGYPAIVDIDVVVKDNVHVLVEVKSRVSKSDVAELYRIGLLYERKHGVKPRLLVIGGFIDPEAYEAAKRLGVEIRPVIRLEEPRI